MAPDVIELTLKFLTRADLKGSEVGEFNTVWGALLALHADATNPQRPPKTMRDKIEEM